jgi:signal transduction histidine kinase
MPPRNSPPVVRDSDVALASIIATGELERRLSRPPDYEAESRALEALAQALAESPRTILQKLAETALELCQAGSAGISLLIATDGGEHFYWPAIAGRWASHVGGGAPRDFAPCGVVLDTNAVQLFSHPERYYPNLVRMAPPIEEALITPFYVRGRAVGTVWVIAHDHHRKFDREDMRQLVTLGRLASAAYQIWTPDTHGITDRKRAEPAQRESQEQLAVELDAVRESEVQWRRASQMLQEAVHAREEFLSIASHELRNPVNALQLQLVALLRGMQENDGSVAPGWARDRVGQALAAVRRLVRLIEILLDVSRITAGRLDLEPEEMDFAQSVHLVVDRFQEQVTDRQITMRVVPLVGSWDKFRLEQVVTNLVSNAIKYGDGLPIEISLEGNQTTACLSITDHGIGIEPDNQKRIFERFERAVSQRHHAGFGLGLWITRQIVDAMGGQISVESRPGEGSTFRVTLPRRPGE